MYPVVWWRICYLGHDYRPAVEVRRRLTKLYPNVQRYWIWLAQDLVLTGDKPGARAAYSRAAEMSDSLTLRAIAQQRLKGLQCKRTLRPEKRGPKHMSI